MATIIRQAGFRVVIFANDHAPAHVHARRAGAEAIIDLRPIRVRVNHRMSRAQLRTAREIVTSNSELLLEAWEQIHGDK